MLFLKFDDQSIFIAKTYGTSFIFDIFFILVYLLSTPYFPKKSQLINL